MPLLNPEGPCQGRASKVNPSRPRRECSTCAFYAYGATASLWEITSCGDCANYRVAVHGVDDATPANQGAPLVVGGAPRGVPYTDGVMT